MRGSADAVVEVADLTAALWEMNAVDWRGDYFGWFGLLTAAQFLGIPRDEFIRWSCADPVYAADRPQIERIWNSAQPQHGRAFYAALAGRGIKVARRAVYLQGSLAAKGGASHQPTINLQRRTNGLISWLLREPSADRLFNVACVFAEIVAEGRLPVGNAHKLLWNNCWRLRKAIGDDEFQRTLANAFRRVEEKVLEVSETATNERN